MDGYLLYWYTLTYMITFYLTKYNKRCIFYDAFAFVQDLLAWFLRPCFRLNTFHESIVKQYHGGLLRSNDVLLHQALQRRCQYASINHYSIVRRSF